MNNLPPRRAGWIKVRIVFLAVLLTAGAGAVIHRAWDLQIVRSGTLRRMAEDQYLRDIRLAPKRGTVYDRNGAELAVSVDTDSVWANPRALRRAGRQPFQAAAQLSSVLDLDPDVVARRLSSNRYFVWIKRRITPRQAAVIKAMDIDGVSILAEARRFYPNRELAAHVLGFANVDGVGIDGLELGFEDRLRGSVESVPAIRDRRGAVVFSSQLLDDRAAHGDHLYLTIDKTIQRAAERELELAVRTFEARAGSVVVIDPRTGEVLAMANHPTFNPNRPGDSPAAHRRNRAITDRFEPGSTTKAFTVAGALAIGAIRPDRLIDCENGELRVAEHKIRDTRKWGMLTPSQILAYSSNIGTAKIGLAMGRAALFRTLRRFGFGQRTGLPLPGETDGILRHYRRWYEMDAASIAFGQGMSVTAVQLAFAMGAIANRGRLLRPIIVKRVTDGRGQVVEQAAPRLQRQVVPAWTAQLVTDMLTGVTGEGGTGEEAAIKGFLVAGKTGTAQKADYVNGGYAEGKWISSFVGFVPVRRPRVVVAVTIDEPVIAHYGGTVASPVFRRVAETALRHLGVARADEKSVLASHVRSGRQKTGQPDGTQPESDGAGTGPTGNRGRATTRRPGKDEVIVPDLMGITARAALLAARDAELEVKLEGTGRVIFQHPAALEIVKRGAVLRLVLASPLQSKEQETPLAAKSNGDNPRIIARAGQEEGNP